MAAVLNSLAISALSPRRACAERRYNKLIRHRMFGRLAGFDYNDRTDRDTLSPESISGIEMSNAMTVYGMETRRTTNCV